ncbi:AraC family transcriptional regulator [Paenibacillus sp. J5C_2022]|uniref:helix-turn-helix domain-containing protein n=1 Tax=Paenibacillus sp. J5C2022 TaxID=2977129 RepID=UPI0021CE6462|nr:AraC family transcriptional regulator [Paenibacillus sp. J5C2022]MCU6709817.1 AraC family transcriptional regulator [Paenibacillus sp. J5C2022]
MKQRLGKAIGNRRLMLRLFMNFMAVIVLFVGFSLASLWMFKKSVHEEIVKYNYANLNVTTRSFEQYFQTLTSVLMDLQLNNEAFRKFTESTKLDYVMAAKLIETFNATTNNAQLYLQDLILYDKELSFALDKVRGSGAEAMFSKHHINVEHSPGYWLEQLEQPFAIKLHPVTSFAESHADKGTDVFPFMVKNRWSSEYFILALIDTDRLIGQLHQSINKNLYILDEQGNALLAYDSNPSGQLPSLDFERNWIKSGDNYYFYKKGSATGLTYVNVVPDTSVSQPVERLIILLVVLLVLATAIGIIASIYFSVRYSNPVRKIVETIRKETAHSHDGRGNEFELIQRNISRMMQVNRDALQDLEEKSDQLRYYSFMNNLKRIRDNLPYVHGDEEVGRPYRFVLFELKFRQGFQEELHKDASYYIREYIHQAIRTTDMETLIFQIEGDQILAVVYGNEPEEKVMEPLQPICSVLAEDRTYCFFTIAVGSLFEQADEMKDAYREVQQLSRHRPFDDETRIVGPGGEPDMPFLPYGSIEQEIDVNLHEGNDAHVIQSLKRLTVQMAKKYSRAHFHEFAKEVTAKVFRKLHAQHLDTVCVSGLPEVIGHIHTVEELHDYFDTLLSEAGRLIRLKKEEHDPIVYFVSDYMEEHFKEEISLEGVAEKLNITGGYLSTYFKEKTGINFVDYVNEFRVKKAMDMLLKADLRIQDIAQEAGYLSLSSFNRAFKKFSGVTPSEYRRNNLNAGATDSA